tara:strand:+ start:906 stop:1382 length:477 start_codon:yes stop_codon:yes gene_type:complete
MARPYLGGTFAGIKEITANTTLGKSDSGLILYLNSTSAVTITLPTDANVFKGYTVKFIVQTANDNGYKIKSGDIADDGGDDFVGGIILATTTAADCNFIAPSANDSAISLDANLNDAGGEKGSYVELMKLSDNEWMVSGCVYSDDTDSDGSAVFTNVS